MISGVASILLLQFAWTSFSGAEISVMVTAKLMAFMVL
jgi:hypothetical protein